MTKVIEATYEEIEERLRNEPYQIFTPLNQESTPRGYSRKHLIRLHPVLKMNDFYLDNKVRGETI